MAQNVRRDIPPPSPISENYPANREKKSDRQKGSNYKKAAIGCAILLAIGAVLILIGNAVVLPSEYKTFLWIPYAANPEYFVSLFLKASLMISGTIVLIMAPLYAIWEIVFGK